MPLTIITAPKREHWGTKDPATGIFFDYEGKADGCIEAARTFAEKVNSDPLNANPVEFIEVSSTDKRAENLAELVHPREYLTRLNQACIALEADIIAGRALKEPRPFGKEAMVSPETHLAAYDSVECAFRGYEILKRSFRKTVHVTTRTPGHHAKPDQADGFCYVNPIAVIARLAVQEHERVAIFDIDYHDADGTSESLAEIPGIHIVDLCGRTPFDEKTQTYQGLIYDKTIKKWVRGVTEYPYRHDSPEDGLLAAPSRDASNITRIEFLETPYETSKNNPYARGTPPETIINRLICEGLPPIEKLDPTLILISLGVDSLQGDPIGGLGQTSGSLYLIARGLRERFPNAKVMSFMEGGYHEEGWKTGIPPFLAGLHADLGTKGKQPAISKRFLGAMIDSPYREAILNEDLIAVLTLSEQGHDLKSENIAVQESIKVLMARARRKQSLESLKLS